MRTHGQAPGRGCGARSTEPRCLCVLCCSTVACDTESTSLRIDCAPRYTSKPTWCARERAATSYCSEQMTQLTGKRVMCHSTGCHHYCEPTIRGARATALHDTCMIRLRHVEYARTTRVRRQFRRDCAGNLACGERWLHTELVGAGVVMHCVTRHTVSQSGLLSVAFRLVARNYAHGHAS